MELIQANVTGRKIGAGRENEEPKALTVREFMRSYKLSRASVYKLINAGTLKSQKVLGKRLISAESAKALLEPETALQSAA